MTKHFNKTHLLVSCLAFSILVHILFIYALRIFGTYDFTAPINQSQLVVVDLAKPANTVFPTASPEKQGNSDTDNISEDKKLDKITEQARKKDYNSPPSSSEQRQPEPIPADSSVIGAEKVRASTRSSEATSVNSPGESRQSAIANVNISPLRTASDFLTTKNEKLTYLISMLGLPVGTVELDAKNVKGEIWLTLRVKSNAAISSIFPVDDIVETRHISGQFIMTKIKQQEGSFKSDQGFTINLRKKRVSWIDNISSRSLTMTVPTDDVLDTLSGIYFLRNRQLQIEKTETLHIYDSETYADVPVEILRRETVLLPNFTKVDTLVVRPLQQTAGIFRRTGDILIWMTDDAYKVPVKIVTSVALGKVTIELLSAESKPLEEEVKESE
jgi:Protein of unknown function (DUF3108)